MGDADQGGQQHHLDPGQEAETGALNDPAEQVAPQPVGPERVLQAGVLQGDVEVLVVRVVGREQRREGGHQQERDEDHDGEHHQAVAPQQAQGQQQFLEPGPLLPGERGSRRHLLRGVEPLSHRGDENSTTTPRRKHAAPTVTSRSAPFSARISV